MKLSDFEIFDLEIFYFLGAKEGFPCIKFTVVKHFKIGFCILNLLKIFKEFGKLINLLLLYFLLHQTLIILLFSVIKICYSILY